MMKLLGHPSIGYLSFALSFALLASIVLGSPSEPRRCRSGIPVGLTTAGCPEDLAKLEQGKLR